IWPTALGLFVFVVFILADIATARRNRASRTTAIATVSWSAPLQTILPSECWPDGGCYIMAKNCDSHPATSLYCSPASPCRQASAAVGGQQGPAGRPPLGCLARAVYPLPARPLGDAPRRSS